MDNDFSCQQLKSHFPSLLQANMSFLAWENLTKNILFRTILILSGTKIILSGQKDGALENDMSSDWLKVLGKRLAGN